MATMEEKKKAWDYAFGLIQVDGLKPTPEFKEMVEKEIRGEITDEDLLEYIRKTYTEKGAE